jgi:hypothetical protein
MLDQIMNVNIRLTSRCFHYLLNNQQENIVMLDQIINDQFITTVVCFHFSEPLGSSTGKCSHGGPDDESRTGVARCGINKDSVSAKWSPHHYLHKQAYAAAVEATTNYLIANGIYHVTC